MTDTAGTDITLPRATLVDIADKIDDLHCTAKIMMRQFEETKRELEATKKAKAENDERFTNERDAARLEAADLKRELQWYADAKHLYLKPEIDKLVLDDLPVFVKPEDITEVETGARARAAIKRYW